MNVLLVISLCPLPLKILGRSLGLSHLLNKKIDQDDYHVPSYFFGCRSSRRFARHYSLADIRLPVGPRLWCFLTTLLLLFFHSQLHSAYKHEFVWFLPSKNICWPLGFVCFAAFCLCVTSQTCKIGGVHIIMPILKMKLRLRKFIF